jgi:hypothetical protein
VAGEIRIVRGTPTPEELAAVVSVLALRAAGPEPDPVQPGSRWVTSARPGYAYRDGRPARLGAGAWRASTLPR